MIVHTFWGFMNVYCTSSWNKDSFVLAYLFFWMYNIRWFFVYAHSLLTSPDKKKKYITSLLPHPTKCFSREPIHLFKQLSSLFSHRCRTCTLHMKGTGYMCKKRLLHGVCSNKCMHCIQISEQSILWMQIVPVNE